MLSKNTSAPRKPSLTIIFSTSSRLEVIHLVRELGATAPLYLSVCNWSTLIVHVFQRKTRVRLIPTPNNRRSPSAQSSGAPVSAPPFWEKVFFLSFISFILWTPVKTRLFGRLEIFIFYFFVLFERTYAPRFDTLFVYSSVSVKSQLTADEHISWNCHLWALKCLVRPNSVVRWVYNSKQRWHVLGGFRPFMSLSCAWCMFCFMYPRYKIIYFRPSHKVALYGFGSGTVVSSFCFELCFTRPRKFCVVYAVLTCARRQNAHWQCMHLSWSIYFRRLYFRVDVIHRYIDTSGNTASPCYCCGCISINRKGIRSANFDLQCWV